MSLKTVFCASLIGITATFIILSYKKWKRNKIPTSWVLVGTVTKLYIYPLKSGFRLQLDEAECTEVGLKQVPTDPNSFLLQDRQLVVYGSEDFKYRTGQTYHKLLMVKLTVYNKDQFVLSAPKMDDIYIPIPNNTNKNVINIKCWGIEELPGIDCGDKVAAWLSQFVLEEISGFRLALHTCQKRRDITKTHPQLLRYYKRLTNQDTGLFAYLSSVHLINENSLEDLNSKIGHSSIKPENYRANIYIKNFENVKPYAEDKWNYVKIGSDCILQNVKECTRCVYTTIDADSGLKSTNRQPLTTLQNFRMSKGPEKLGTIGINLGVRKVGLLKVGDLVYVNESANV